MTSLLLVLALFVPDPPTTPVERARFETLTSHAQLCAYVESLQTLGVARVETIGLSAEGRAIVLMRFAGEPTPSTRVKPRVLIFCQQHGTEPSGKEAALLLARHLAHEPTVRARLEVLLVPQVNPDGAERRTRDNALGIDLNRDHVSLSAPETQALHRLFLREMPEVTLDVHEYFPFTSSWIAHGMVKDADVMIGEMTNPNIDESLRAMARSLMERVGARVRARGYSCCRYVVGSPGEGARLRPSTTDLNDGRNSFGIYHTLSFIQEGKRYGDGAEHLELRVRSQEAAMEAFLEVVAEEAESIVGEVRSARDRVIAHGSRWVHVRYDYFPDSSQASVTVPVFDLYGWRRVERALGNFHASVRPTRSLLRPSAYLVEPGHDRLLEVLARHGVQTRPLGEGWTGEAEEYLILHVTPTTEEELEVLDVDAWRQPSRTPLAKGTVVVPLDQPAGLLIPLLLEPASTRGLCSSEAAGAEHFAAYLRPGTVFPIRRLLAP